MEGCQASFCRSRQIYCWSNLLGILFIVAEIILGSELADSLRTTNNLTTNQLIIINTNVQYRSTLVSRCHSYWSQYCKHVCFPEKGSAAEQFVTGPITVQSVHRPNHPWACVLFSFSRSWCRSSRRRITSTTTCDVAGQQSSVSQSWSLHPFRSTVDLCPEQCQCPSLLVRTGRIRWMALLLVLLASYLLDESHKYIELTLGLHNRRGCT